MKLVVESLMVSIARLIRFYFLDRMKIMMKADDEYRRLLKVMDRDPDFDNKDIEMFKATELVRRSIDLVKLRAKA